MSRAPAGMYDGVTENDFQEQVFTLAGYNGWKVAHFRTARVGDRWMTPVAADGAGWPDLFLVHPPTGDSIAVELKREKGRVSPAQVQWLAWLELAGIEVAIWRPSQIDTIIKRLRKPRQ